MNYDREKLDSVMGKVEALRSLNRENTRELLSTKKDSITHERQLIEEKTALKQELKALSEKFSIQLDKSERAEKVKE